MNNQNASEQGKIQILVINFTRLRFIKIAMMNHLNELKLQLQSFKNLHSS